MPAKKRKPRGWPACGAFLCSTLDTTRIEPLIKHTPKTHVGVKGNMSENTADEVGRKLANAALILAIGGALALIIYAVRWW